MAASRRLYVVALGGLALGFACSVQFRDNVTYKCTSNADCGGDGFTCAIAGSAPGYCCKPMGAEICGDAIDNDCDGLLDAEDEWSLEVCNNIDDDCDDAVDEGFDLRADAENCGQCGFVCAADKLCVAGMCVARSESQCGDGIDNDGNGKTDCEDFSCVQASCGSGCQCLANMKSEQYCGDLLDNDRDLKVDCADTDCESKSCVKGIVDGGPVTGMCIKTDAGVRYCQ